MSDSILFQGESCFNCRHLLYSGGMLSQDKGERGKCEAFPDGIPDDIWFHGIEHDKMMPGQLGDFVYEEPIPPVFDDPEYGAPPMLDPDSTSD